MRDVKSALCPIRLWHRNIITFFENSLEYEGDDIDGDGLDIDFGLSFSRSTGKF